MPSRQAVRVAGGGDEGCGPELDLLSVESRTAMPGEELSSGAPAERDTPAHRCADAFIDYMDALTAALPAGAECSFPTFVATKAPTTPAERVAQDILFTGQGSIWTAVRQVISELQFKPTPRALDDSQLCYRLGAYGHRSFVGLHQETSKHEATCVLLNAFVKLVRPSRQWTTLSVNVDSQASPHRDRQNFGLSLVIGVSHFVDGSLWIEQDGGDCYEEYSGDMIPGVCMAVSGHAVLFDARACLHAVRPWTGGNRLTLLAYSIGQYGSLSHHQRAQLP